MGADAVLKSAIDQVAARAGVEVIAKWRMPTLAYATRLQRLFEYFAITSVIDIGANNGHFHDQIRHEVGFEGPVFSFEPDPGLSEELALRAAADPLWTVFPFALGAAAGTLPINIMNNSVYNSFHQPTEKPIGEFGHGNCVSRTVNVEVRALDAMAGEFPDLSHTYVKIDTQGFDLEVLKGGRDVMRQVPALQTEVSLLAQYLDAPMMDASIAAFSELGFGVADLFLVSTNGRHRAIEFDCIMVRDC